MISMKPGREKAQQGAWESTTNAIAKTAQFYFVRESEFAIALLSAKDASMFYTSFLTDLVRNAADSEIKITRIVYPVLPGQSATLSVSDGDDPNVALEVHEAPPVEPGDLNEIIKREFGFGPR